MNKISKGILIAVIVIVGLILIKTVTTPITQPNQYATEAVRVLEKYKDFDIDAEEAADRLGNLMDVIRAEEAKAENKKEKTKLNALWLDLVSIYTDLRHYGRAAGYDVDEAIKSIKATK